MTEDRTRIPEDDMKDTSTEEKRDTVMGGVGGLGGLAAGAAGGLALGPVGAVIGALAGAAGGWWAGKHVADAAAEFDAEEEAYRRAHTMARPEDRSYAEVRHAYQLGHLAGRNPEYRRSGFETVEQDLRRAWAEAHGHADDWDTIRPYVDRGFTRARERDARR